MTRAQILLFADEVPPATTEALEERGIEVSKVETLDDALEWKEGECDCILGVPESDDIETLVTELRTGFPDCPIVLSIAGGPELGIEDQLKPGVLDYVRPTDLREHGELVAHRIETAITASQQPTESDLDKESAQSATQAANTLAAATEATSSLDLDLEAKLDRILTIATEEMGFPIGYATRIKDGTQEILAATGDHDAIQLGETDPLERTYCRHTIEQDRPVVVEDAPDEGWADDPAYQHFGLRCYVGAPIIVDGEPYGTLCLADEQPRQGLVGDLHQATVKALARWVGHEIERQHYERALTERRNRLRVLFDKAPDGIVAHDADGSVLDVNETLVDKLGYTRTELLSMDVSEFEVGFDRDFLTEAWEDMDEELPLKVEGQHQRHDGSTYPVGVWVSKIDSADGEHYIAVCRDVTERKERERELERYEAFVQHSSAIVTELDESGTITYQSPAIERVLGYEPDDLVGEHAFEYIHPDDRERVTDAFAANIDEPRAERTIEFRFESASGEYRWLHAIGANHLDDPAIGGVVVNSIDVTERKQRERELERYRAYLESANDMVTLIAPDGTIEYVSPAVERILGYTQAGLIGENGFEYLHPNDRDDQRENIDALIDESDGEMTLEFRFECAEGGYCWIEATARNLLDNPDVDGVLLSSRDVTDRKEHQQQLSALHGATRQLIDADSKAAVAETAVEAASTLLDFTLPSVWYPSDDRSELALVANSQEHQALLEEAGTPEPAHPEESWIWDVIEERETVVKSPIPQEELAADVPLQSTIVLPLGEHGIFACAAKGEVEFTERQIRVAEILARNARVALDQLDQRAALERQKAFTDDLLDAIEDVVYVLDPDGDLRQWNDALERVTGYTSAEIASMNAVDFFAGEDRDAAADAVREAFETGRTRVELEFVTSDGEVVPYEFMANVFEDPDGQPVMAGIGRDRTVHVEYEQELERYKELIDNVPAGIYRDTPGEAGEFVEVNPAMVEIFDADSAEELLDTPVRDLYTDPDARQLFSDAILEEGIVKEEEMELETLDGETFWGSVTAMRFETADETYFDGVVQDITERVEYEQRLEEQRDNLDILNQMVRHDIRNDLQLIIAYAEMIEDQLEGKHKEYVEIVLENAENAVDLTKTARDLAEAMLHEETDVKPVPLKRTLETQIEEIRTANEEAVVTVSDPIPSEQSYADGMLDSVFRNLLTNAVAHNDKDVPEIEIHVEEADEHVRIEIADNGPGVPDEQKEEIFGKGAKGLESEGTGMGLYLVHTLVERYNGEVWVTDNTPEGAIFNVKLRIA